MMDNAMLHLLKRSFVEELEPAEKDKLEKALSDSPELRDEKKQLESLKILLTEQEYSFSASFAEKVMTRIEVNEKYEADNAFLFAFNRIALPGLAAAIILLLFTILNNGTFSFESILGVESLQTEYFSEILLFNY
jgi:hypothetical protein